MTATTLYVDVENLQELAKKVITMTVEQWPADFPKLDSMRLYVRADQMKLWQIWGSHAFPSVKVVVEGIQRYGYGIISKNLADMALVLDAITDLLKGRTTHVAILSDDSDYVALFSIMKREIASDYNDRLPFIWFLTDRPDTHSQALNDFLPSSYLKTIPISEIKSIVTPVKIAVPPVKLERPVRRVIRPSPAPVKKNEEIHGQSVEESIAITIIREMPVGPFKSTECRKVVLRYFPEHQLSKVDSPTFGNHFAKNIWPILERFGVRLPNPEKKPRKYEMTEEAKKNIPAS